MKLKYNYYYIILHNLNWIYLETLIHIISFIQAIFQFAYWRNDIAFQLEDFDEIETDLRWIWEFSNQILGRGYFASAGEGPKEEFISQPNWFGTYHPFLFFSSGVQHRESPCFHLTIYSDFHFPLAAMINDFRRSNLSSVNSETRLWHWIYRMA